MPLFSSEKWFCFREKMVLSTWNQCTFDPLLFPFVSLFVDRYVKQMAHVQVVNGFYSQWERVQKKCKSVSMTVPYTLNGREAFFFITLHSSGVIASKQKVFFFYSHSVRYNIQCASLSQTQFKSSTQSVHQMHIEQNSMRKTDDC